MSQLTRNNLGFLLAKAMQRWNEMLSEGFAQEGFEEMRPSFGSVLIPLFEEDGLRIGDLARRSRLTKQTMTTMVRAVEKAEFVTLRADPDDGRASRVTLTPKARRFQPVAERLLKKIEARLVRNGSASDMEAVRRWLTFLANSTVDM